MQSLFNPGGGGVAFVKSNKQQLFNIVAAWGRDNSLDKQV